MELDGTVYLATVWTLHASARGLYKDHTPQTVHTTSTSTPMYNRAVPAFLQTLVTSELRYGLHQSFDPHPSTTLWFQFQQEQGSTPEHCAQGCAWAWAGGLHDTPA